MHEKSGMHYPPPARGKADTGNQKGEGRVAFNEACAPEDQSLLREYHRLVHIQCPFAVEGAGGDKAHKGGAAFFVTMPDCQKVSSGIFNILFGGGKLWKQNI